MYIFIENFLFWYAHQMFQVKWDNVVSAPYCVSNGVWQGGILSPILFNVYIDELSDQLNRLKTVLWATLLLIVLCMQTMSI